MRAARDYASGKGGGSSAAVIEKLHSEGIRDPELERSLRGNLQSRKKAIARISELRSVLELRHPGSKIDAEKTAHAILSDPIFKKAKAETGESVFGSIGRWIRDLIEKVGAFFRRLTSGLSPSGPGIANFIFLIMISLGIAAIIVGAYFVIRKFNVRLVRRTGSKVVEADEYVSASVSDWLRRAEQYAASGNWRLAVRCLYMATLARLDEAGMIRYESGLTNWEYVRRTRRSGGERLLPILEPMTLDFDQFWYGMLDPNDRDYGRAQAAYTGISGLIGERAA